MHWLKMSAQFFYDAHLLEPSLPLLVSNNHPHMWPG